MNAFDDALTFHRDRLARLKSIIEKGADSPYPGVRTASQSLVPERDRLALLLDAFDGKVDVILPNGSHRYWSTHCRHAELLDGYEAKRLHDMCSASEMTGRNVQDREGWSATIARNPAQCKHCQAPCLCSCHKTGSEGEAP